MMKILKWAIITLTTIVALIGLAYAVGLTLPRDHTATSAVTLATPREQVWGAIVDVAAQPSWRTGLETVTVESPALESMKWTEHGDYGEIPLRVVERVEPSRLVVVIDGDDLPFGGRWIYQLDAVDGGTRLSITEEGSVYNPVFRVMSSLFMSEYETLDTFLTDLGRHFSQQVTPEHE
jgi:hypothetical protein